MKQKIKIRCEISLRITQEPVQPHASPIVQHETLDCDSLSRGGLQGPQCPVRRRTAPIEGEEA